MSKITRRLVAFAVCVCALAGFSTTTHAAPGPVDVQLRVETPDETVFNGGITTGARLASRGVNLAPSPPDPNTCIHAYDPGFNYLKLDVADATTLTVAADFADSEGLDHIVKDFGWGRLLCGIGSYLGNNDQFWLVKVNNKTQTAGGGFVTSDTEVKSGDEVLWYFTNPLITHTLDLDLPAQVFVGETVSGTVNKYSNTNDSKTPARGASVDGGGASGVADTSGKARLKFAQEGSYLVSASARGATRGSDVIEVLAPPSPKATSKARRVCAKYRRGWRKYNKRFKKLYKRCYRSATLRFADGS